MCGAGSQSIGCACSLHLGCCVFGYCLVRNLLCVAYPLRVYPSKLCSVSVKAIHGIFSWQTCHMCSTRSPRPKLSPGQQRRDRAMATKKTAAAIGAVREPRRYVSARVQVNGIRLLCRPDRANELRQELVKAAKKVKTKTEWKKVAAEIGSQDKWGVSAHGGARKGSNYCPSRSGSSSGIGVDSKAAAQHISISSSTGSSAAIGVCAGSTTQTNKPIRRRLRGKQRPTSIEDVFITAEIPAIGGVEASLLEASLAPTTDAEALEPSVVVRRSPSSVICSKASVSVDSNKALAIGSVEANLPQAPCTPTTTPTADAQCMEASIVSSRSPAIGSGTIGSTSPAIGKIKQDLPRVLPATQPLGSRRSATYTIIERIAGGSFGDVYKAKPKQNGSGLPSTFVVKLTHKSLRQARSTTEQERELSVMKELTQSKHPNILKLVGWRGTHFNVQLFFELHDQDLRRYIKGKPLPSQICKKLSHDVARAVACVHSHSILHRDIKPANILIRCQPLAAILGDFGCARKLLPEVDGASQQQQALTQDVCTLWYRAPEILLSHDGYGYASDVWSLGIVMVEMQNGIPPFRGSSEIGMLLAMFKMLGTPIWSKEVTMMRDFRGVLGTCAFPSFPRPHVFPFGSQLIEATLHFSPSMRISADSLVDKFRC